MSTVVLIACITFFILSIVISFVLAIMHSKIKTTTIKIFYLLHFVLFFALLVLVIINYYSGKVNYATSFLSISVCCSGLAFAGIIIRSSVAVFLKIYFAIYFLSILLFLISPSKLFSFITTGKMYSNTSNTFCIRDNFYLELQQSMMENKSGQMRYKIYQKLGMFNRTISRDINFGYKIDSTKTLFFDDGKIALLRGYFTVNTRIDSVDKRIDLTIPLQQNTITKGKP